MTNKEFSYRATFFGSLGMLIILILTALFGCCSIGQIPTQFYFVNDSCNFFLPDYSEVVKINDNCCVEQLVQDPPSGMMLAPGTDITVTLTAMDCYGNTSTMEFQVVTIDTIPPTFHYDSAQFIPSGMFQNDVRTWHLYTVLDTFPEEDIGIMMKHYYRSSDWPVPLEASMDTSGIRPNYFRSRDYWKRQFFTAETDYKIENIKLPLFRVGYPGTIKVELWESDSTDSLVKFVSIGSYDGSRLWREEEDFKIMWHIVEMREAEIQEGVTYAIQVNILSADNENYVAWYTNDASKTDYYLMYSYDNMETWGRNREGNYMFEIWGVKI